MLRRFPAVASGFQFSLENTGPRCRDAHESPIRYSSAAADRRHNQCGSP